MRKVRVGLVGMVLAVLPFIAARAEDPRCKVPPYGGADAKFRSFAETFGVLVTPAKVLSGVCDAKFGGDRSGLDNLGFTDADIDTRDTADLAVEVVGAIRNIARHSN
jgi:hypothetical protein